MDWRQYQEAAQKTAIYPNQGNNLNYPTLGLVSEAGEVAGEVKKVARDDGGILTRERREKIASEMGDVLWYLSALSYEIGIPLDVIAEMNIQKLQVRAEAGKIQGSGSER